MKQPLSCTLTVWRMQDGEKIAYTATCRFSEYVQKVKDKVSGEWRPRANWQRQPFNMLEKCTEAKALRKGFQQEMGPVRAAEELGVIDITLEDQDGGDVPTGEGGSGKGLAYDPGTMYLGEIKNIVAGAGKKAPGRIVLSR